MWALRLFRECSSCWAEDGAEVHEKNSDIEVVDEDAETVSLFFEDDSGPPTAEREEVHRQEEVLGQEEVPQTEEAQQQEEMHHEGVARNLTCQSPEAFKLNVEKGEIGGAIPRPVGDTTGAVGEQRPRATVKKETRLFEPVWNSHGDDDVFIFGSESCAQAEASGCRNSLTLSFRLPSGEEKDLLFSRAPLGMDFVRTTGSQVQSIRDKGHAARAGVKPGWKIVAVNDEGVEDLEFDDFLNLVMKETASLVQSTGSTPSMRSRSKNSNPSQRSRWMFPFS